MNVAYNMDCMEAMRKMPDNVFDLAVVDPPYGIGMDGGCIGYKGNNVFEKRDGTKKPRLMNIFENCFAFLKIKLYGEVIILNSALQGAYWFGIKGRDLKEGHMQRQNWHGLLLIQM